MLLSRRAGQKFSFPLRLELSATPTRRGRGRQCRGIRRRRKGTACPYTAIESQLLISGRVVAGREQGDRGRHVVSAMCRRGCRRIECVPSRSVRRAGCTGGKAVYTPLLPSKGQTGRPTNPRRRPSAASAVAASSIRLRQLVHDPLRRKSVACRRSHRAFLPTSWAARLSLRPLHLDQRAGVMARTFGTCEGDTRDHMVRTSSGDGAGIAASSRLRAAAILRWWYETAPSVTRLIVEFHL